MAPHPSTLALRIPWTEEPGRLQSMRLLRVRHNWATSLSLFTFMHWRRKWQPLQCSCLENPTDGGAWWAAVYGVAQSRTRLTWLSSSSGSHVIKIIYSEDFSGSSVAETPCFQCRRPGFDPWSGNYIPYATTGVHIPQQRKIKDSTCCS